MKIIHHRFLLCKVAFIKHYTHFLSALDTIAMEIYQVETVSIAVVIGISLIGNYQHHSNIHSTNFVCTDEIPSIQAKKNAFKLWIDNLGFRLTHDTFDVHKQLISPLSRTLNFSPLRHLCQSLDVFTTTLFHSQSLIVYSFFFVCLLLVLWVFVFVICLGFK